MVWSANTRAHATRSNTLDAIRMRGMSQLSLPGLDGRACCKNLARLILIYLKEEIQTNGLTDPIEKLANTLCECLERNG